LNEFEAREDLKIDRNLLFWRPHVLNATRLSDRCETPVCPFPHGTLSISKQRRSMPGTVFTVAVSLISCHTFGFLVKTTLPSVKFELSPLSRKCGTESTSLPCPTRSTPNTCRPLNWL